MSLKFKFNVFFKMIKLGVDSICVFANIDITSCI